eukprot:c11126_g1_i1 orf=127-2415(+)
MNKPVMGNTGADTEGFVLSQHNQPLYLELHDATNLKEEHLGLNAVFAKEGILKEECTAVQVDGFRQAYAPTNGMYVVGPGMKDIAGTVSASNGACLMMSSGLHGAEGAAKDLSAFLGSSYSTVFSDSLGSIFNETRSSEVTATTWHRPRPVLLQRPQNSQIKDMETSKEVLSQAPLRIVRPPGEGRGKNQMLPRYWPRMTDQELRQLTTQDSNTKVTPLFEKVLSASDAGKIGRLVLPKACAEAYFPPISQAEEGITPCIQSMNLQAGDTVIFSRLDPEGKLLMGYRRAPNLSSAEENQKPITAGSMVTASLRLVSPGNTDNVSTVTSLTKLLMQTEESSSKAQSNRKPGQFNVRAADNGYTLYKMEKFGSKTQEGSYSDLHIVNEKRKAKEISPKKKRQKFDAEKVEFRKNWDDAQKLLRSPPHVTPSIVTIEGYDFEEYEEPPVFGKDILFTTCSARNVCSEQDAEKDKASSLSQHAKAVEKQGRSLDATVKKEVVVGSLKAPQPYSGLETLANVATTEGNNSESAVSSAATTTKHPRHRPGCSCIVCIQPPSGKGPKHKPNCDCNVCLTVKRRFQTLMLRRKKLQSERAAENAAQRNHHYLVTGVENNFGERRTVEPGFQQSGSWQSAQFMEGSFNGNKMPPGYSSMRSYAIRGVSSEFEQLVASKGTQFDLNSQPEREEEMNKSAVQVSMKRLLQNAGYPLDTYLKEQGLTSLVYHDQVHGSSESPVRNATVPKEEEHEYNLSAVVFMNSDGLEVEPN